MKKVLLIIKDGFGWSLKKEGNAVKAAHMPFFDKLRKKYPFTLLQTKGHASGLPEGQTGASEPGHLILGAGRIVWQSLENINQSFKNKSILKNKSFKKFLNQSFNRKIHLVGLLSDGGVHSHINHLENLLEILAKEKIKKENIFLHAIADGRDVKRKSIAKYLDQIKKTKKCQLASLIGRFYAMDRDKNWQRTKQAFDLLTAAKGEKLNFNKINETIYNQAESDYYLKGFVFPDFKKIAKQDLVLLFNFRSDRSEQLTSAFTQDNFSEWKRDFYFPKNKEQFFVFGPYHQGNAWNIFPPPKVKNNLGEVLAYHGLKQLRIAETEKFAHVTFFFNAQNKKPFPQEERILIPSKKCLSFAECPQMSAKEITIQVCSEIKKKKFSVIVLNFANADLVGHSGKFEKAKASCEVLDQCLSKIVPLAIGEDYQLIITADHGNSDEMLYENGEISCAHSKNPVPCILITDKKIKPFKKRQNFKIEQGLEVSGQLQDIAPTILDMLELPSPAEMTGESFLI